MKKSIIINLLLALVMAPLGIEAKKKAKTVEVPQLINYPSAELGEYRLHGGNVVIQGRIVAPEEYCKPGWSKIMCNFVVDINKVRITAIQLLY